MVKLEKFIIKIKGKLLKYNIENSFFGHIEMGYLGFWVTRKGVRPVSKTFKSVVNLYPPEYKLVVHTFILLINFYKHMWSRKSHTIQPLNKLM